MDKNPKDALKVVASFVCTLENDTDANNTFLAFNPPLH